MFKIGDRVVMVRDNVLKYGNIHKAYMNLSNPVVFVDIEDDEIVKVSIDDIAPAPPSQVSTTHKREDKNGITITPNEFHNVIVKALADTLKGNGKDSNKLGLILTVFSARLHKALFSND